MNIFKTFQKKKQAPWKRRIQHWKFFFYTTFVLPVFAVVLAVKVIKTYVRIKLREIAIAQEGPGQSD